MAAWAVIRPSALMEAVVLTPSARSTVVTVEPSGLSTVRVLLPAASVAVVVTVPSDLVSTTVRDPSVPRVVAVTVPAALSVEVVVVVPSGLLVVVVVFSGSAGGSVPLTSEPLSKLPPPLLGPLGGVGVVGGAVAEDLTQVSLEPTTVPWGAISGCSALA